MQNRIKELRKAKGMKQKTLADQLGVTTASLSFWENDVYDISPTILTKIAQIFDVSVDYLIYNDSVKRRKPVGAFSNVIPIATKKVPLLGTIACGEPLYAEEQYGEYAVVSNEIDCDFCLRAKGDSMIGARINDGDLVFVRQTDAVENGKIAAVVIEDEATLKRVYLSPDKLVLAAENPAFPPFVYVGEELEKIKILGEAVAFQSLVR